jgi:hypothetical protein
MCAQCMAAAATAGATATGLRAWLAIRGPAWMTARRLRLATVAILVVAVLAAGTQIPGSGA